MKRFLSTLLIIFGISWVILGDYYYWIQHSPTSLAFSNYSVKNSNVKTNSKSDEKKSLPVSITISDLNISLPIIPAKVENDNWEMSYAGASYLTSSPIPGENGNSVIYAHNWTKLFGNLIDAKEGQDITISYADGTQKRFVIKSTSTVDPTESYVLGQTKDQRITLYTCTGFLDTKRFVAVANYDKNPTFAEVIR